MGTFWLIASSALRQIDYVEPHAIASRTNLDGVQVQRALRSLVGEDPPFFSVTENPSLGGGPSFFDVHNPKDHARRTVGSWPTPQSLAESIVAAFREATDNEQEETEKGRLRAHFHGSSAPRGGITTSRVRNRGPRPAFLEGHVLALAHFGGIPARVRDDNLGPAVVQVLARSGTCELPPAGGGGRPLDAPAVLRPRSARTGVRDRNRSWRSRTLLCLSCVRWPASFSAAGRDRLDIRSPL